MSFSWSQFPQADCYPDRCQCEAVRDQLIRQPSSFWSSLAYVFAGLILYKLIHKKTLVLKLWTFVCVLMGLSSMFGHGTYIKLALALDFASIFIVFSFFAFYNYFKKRGYEASKIIVLLFVYYVLLWVGMYWLDKMTKIFMCILIFAFSLADLFKIYGKDFLRHPLVRASIGVLAFSFGLFIIDEMHLGCEPLSLFQWHSVWHLGTGFSMFLYGKWRFEDSSLN